MGWIGAGEIIVILILALILFGPDKLSDLGRMIGSALREIRKISAITADEVLSPADSENEKTIPQDLTRSPEMAVTNEENFDESKYPENLADQENGKEEI